MQNEKIKQSILEKISDRGTDMSKVKDSTKIADLGLDSLDISELLMSFEEEYNIAIDMEKVDLRTYSVQGLTDYLGGLIKDA